MKIKLKDSSHISRHVGSICSEAPDTTFTSKIDIDKWAAVPGKYYYCYLLLFHFWGKLKKVY